MFNIILSIFTSIYWLKHCNVSRSKSFMEAWKPFALTSQSTTSLSWMTMLPLQMSCQYHARKFACTSFHIGGFLFVRYGHKTSWDFLAVYFISSASLVLYSIRIPLIGEERAGWYMCCCLSVSLYTCVLPLLCLLIWLYAKGNMWFMMFTLHHHHCSFITD